MVWKTAASDKFNGELSAIEPGQSQMDSPAENDAEVDDEKSDEEKNPVTPDSSDSLASTPNLKILLFRVSECKNISNFFRT